MKNISIRFAFIPVFAGIFLAAIFSVLAPGTAYAATAEWKDNFNLTYEGATYQSDDNNDSWYFYRLDDPDGCADVINDISWSPRSAGDKTDTPDDDDTTAKYQERVPSAVGCKDEGSQVDIDLSGHNNVTTGFIWDGEFIRETNGDPFVFEYDEAIGEYIRQGDNSCKDSITTNVGSGTATIVIAVNNNTTVAQRDSQRTNNIMDVYSGHAWISQADYADTANGCWLSETVTVNIGNTSSATDPGSGSESGDIEDGTAGTVTGDTGDSCEDSGWDLSWIACPLLFGADKALNWITDQITQMLQVPDNYIRPPNNPEALQQTWSRFRDIAYMILIPIMLVMVISTALGFEFFSAYTVKKAMPRMVLAVMFITFSFYITEFLVLLTNDIGLGMHGLITGVVSPNGDITLASLFDANLGDSIFWGTAGVLAAAGAVAVAGVTVLLSYAFTTIIVLIIGLFLLALRQMLIIGLMIFAPLAILSWIFPSNDKLWKLWWGSFSKLLLMFPLIMILVATGKVFGFIINQSSGGADAGNGQLLFTGLKLLAFVAPFFFIPATFKFAGGIFGTITGMANDRSRGLFDRQKKYRGRTMGQNWQNTKDGARFGENNAFSRRFNRVGGGIGMGRKGAFGFGERGKTQQSLRRQAREEQAMKENPLLQKFVQTDDDGAAMLGLSGGTNQGLRAASADLQSHWLQQEQDKFRSKNNRDMNDTELRTARATVANRAARAESAAKSMGVNKANAGAALVGVAQNKARALEGDGAIGLVQKGTQRLGGGNDQLESAALQGFMYHARGNGRQDLGHTDYEGAWDKQSIGAIVSGDTRSTQAFADHIANEWNEGMRTNNMEKMESAAIKMAELQGALPGATEGNAKIINDLARGAFRYDESADMGLEDQMAQKINERQSDLLPGQAGPPVDKVTTSGEKIFKQARKYSKDTTEAERMRYQQEEMARRIQGQQQ